MELPSLPKSMKQHWKCNLFEIPRGRVGTEFVQEISRLIDAYSDASALESMALEASMILPHLLLQRPHPRSKSKDHIQCLGDRMAKWQKGDIDSLLHECRYHNPKPAEPP